MLRRSQRRAQPDAASAPPTQAQVRARHLWTAGRARARRLKIKSLEWVPYGLTVDGSAERAAYARHLQGYLAATLRPLFAAWDGELPAHLQKARGPAGLRCMRLPRSWRAKGGARTACLFGGGGAQPWLAWGRALTRPPCPGAPAAIPAHEP